MALYIVPVPIGHPDDFTLRAIAILKTCSAIIVEERKESSRWLRTIGISGKPLYQLNEHSSPVDVDELVRLATESDLALISDSGTPNFCDPGYQLVAGLRQRGVRIEALPGASSLMTLLSYTSRPLRSFLFYGFLPQETEARKQAWQQFKTLPWPLVIMDTPYRLTKTLEEARQHWGPNAILLGCDLTQETQWVYEGPARELPRELINKKAEFLILLYKD
jgi:16S rRNA (cytidine1402-2'-O)-methyltransferase